MYDLNYSESDSDEESSMSEPDEAAFAANADEPEIAEEPMLAEEAHAHEPEHNADDEDSEEEIEVEVDVEGAAPSLIKVDTEEAEQAGLSALPAPLATHAEGLQLHLSNSNRSGYTGVTPNGNKFIAYHMAGGGFRTHIGMAATAVEAAVLYAKYIARAAHVSLAAAVAAAPAAGDALERDEEEDDEKEGEEDEDEEDDETHEAPPLPAHCELIEVGEAAVREGDRVIALDVRRVWCAQPPSHTRALDPSGPGRLRPCPPQALAPLACLSC